MEPVPDAANAEGSCCWALGLFVIRIIKRLSTVYTMVCKYACGGLQAGFLLPLERVARIPRCSVASWPLGKTEAASIPGLWEWGEAAEPVPLPLPAPELVLHPL